MHRTRTEWVLDVLEGHAVRERTSRAEKAQIEKVDWSTRNLPMSEKVEQQESD